MKKVLKGRHLGRFTSLLKLTFLETSVLSSLLGRVTGADLLDVKFSHFLLSLLELLPDSFSPDITEQVLCLTIFSYAVLQMVPAGISTLPCLFWLFQ